MNGRRKARTRRLAPRPLSSQWEMGYGRKRHRQPKEIPQRGERALIALWGKAGQRDRPDLQRGALRTGLLASAVARNLRARLDSNLHQGPGKPNLTRPPLDLPRSLPLQQGLRHEFAQTWGRR